MKTALAHGLGNGGLTEREERWLYRRARRRRPLWARNA
jgi:hypothetical protein